MKTPPAQYAGGVPQLLSGLRSLLPAHTDAGDLLLLAILLLLYHDTGDEDFLILLAVMGLEILKDRGRHPEI